MFQNISGGFVNFGKMISAFLVSFLIMGSVCHAEVAPASREPSSVSAQGAASVAIKTPTKWSDGWFRGAEGYRQAIEEYKKTKKPMVVYINVGWCPYCRRFEREVLSSPLVMNFMKDKIKVNLNPEAGPRESEIVSQYGIRGFPSFFLHPPQPGRAMQLYTGVSPEEFVQMFQQALQ
jgi:thioredoxin-related protein